jgi:hypothetical protein
LVLILFITIFLFEIICKIKIFFLISSSNFFYFPSKYDTGRLFFIVNYFKKNYLLYLMLMLFLIILLN